MFGSCIIYILYTGVLKFKKIIPAPKGEHSKCLCIYVFWMDLRGNGDCFPEQAEANDYFNGDEVSRVREELNF